jgi:lysyl-tRNA synthetase, class I
VTSIYKLYKNISGYNKPGNWYPYQVICPQCGRVGTTIVTDYDGEKVTFVCQKDLVTWAEGCGYDWKIEPGVKMVN